MPRFVVLEHSPSHDNGKPLHWDFMLEWGESLRTWELHEPPVKGRQLDAIQLTDHRLAYLDYEGPVSGDRGNVRQWDRGSFEILDQRADEVEVHLQGSKFDGCLDMKRLEGGQWRFEFAG